MPNQTSPRLDATGNNCGVNQNGPVWFLDPPVGQGKIVGTNTCNIPEGKTIFIPLIVAECGYNVDVDVKTVQKITECAQVGNNGGNIHLYVDGKELLFVKNTGTKDYESSTRMLSDVFKAYSVKNNILGDPEGFDTKIADGYFAMLEPLPVGNHTIKLDVQVIPIPYDFHTTMTYNLKIGGNSTIQS